MRLVRYAARRLLLLVPVLLGVTFIAFWLTRSLPGNPIDRVAGPYVSAERREEMKRAARLHLPFYQQFALYVADLVTKGDMGTSYTTAQPVARDLLERLPATFELTTLGMAAAVALALPLGIAGAVRRGGLLDHLSRVLSVVGVSMPIFWLGLVLLQVFYVRLDWVPAPTGRLSTMLSEPPRVTGMILVDALLAGDGEAFRDALAHMVLPVAVIALTAMAPLARIARSAMIEALESDYVRAAMAFGLPPRVVVFRHALKNALLPIVTMIAAVYGYALGGEVLVELVFSWPGLGLYAYNAILNGDFPAIQGFILLVTALYVAIYLVVDLLVAVIDPRVVF